MKKNYILGLTLVAAVGFLAVQRSGIAKVGSLEKNAHMLSSDGAVAARTGAPGEANCTQCHAGSAQSGTGINQLIMLDGATAVTNYVPGGTYNMALSLNDGDVKEGFQATVLDLSTNSMAGNFPGTGGFGTAITSSGGRDYANHTSTSNTSANITWVWTWDAPATDMGPVKFYVASNVANGNDLSSGDIIYLSEHTFGSAANSIDDLDEIASEFNAGYSSTSNSVLVSFNAKSVDNLVMNLVDLNGKSVYTDHPGVSKLGANSISMTLPEGVKSGMYIVNFFVGNKALKAKILVQ